MKKEKIGLLLLSTRRYKQFVQPLINSVKKHFFINNEVNVHLFTDDLATKAVGDERVKIIKHLIPSYGFPKITLYRYKIFNEHKVYLENESYLFYSDIDMDFCDFVGEEMLPNGENDRGLVAVLHPGFYSGGGSWENNLKSNAYTLPENRKKYYCGGVQGGITKNYLEACRELSDGIADDESRGVMATWHDEAFWNFYLGVIPPKTLDPSYCMVEQQHLREKWGISHFEPKIIALAKNHAELRK